MEDKFISIDSFEFPNRLASVQEQRLPGTGPESSVDENSRSADNHSMNKVRFQSLFNRIGI